MSQLELQSMGVYDVGSGDHPSLHGWAAAKRSASVIHAHCVNEAARLYADCMTGKVPTYMLKEAIFPQMEPCVNWLQENYPGIYVDTGRKLLGLRETMGPTDYQALYVDVLDRLYYGYYSGYPIPNKPMVRVKTLRDFRLVKRYLNDGMVTPLTSSDPAAPPTQRALQPPVPQDGATYAAGTTAPAITYSPLFYQAMASIQWAAFINDDLGIFQDVAQRLALACTRGEHKFITNLYMDSAGPNASLYTTAYGNKIVTANGAASNNPVLNAQGIADALKILAGMRDSGGDPVLITGTPYLWYGPAWTAAAMNLKNSLSTYLTQEGGVAGSAQPGMFVQTTNWFMQNMNLIMDPYIPIVSTSKPLSWGIMIDPNTQNRPALEMGYLNGFATGQIFQKVPNTQRMGGGVDPMMGDFYTGDQDVKVCIAFGGTQIDGRSTVASNGSGS